MSREALESLLAYIEGEMNSAYNRARAVCCGRPGMECCGSPEPEWDEADQLVMDTLAPVQRALRAALAEAEDADDKALRFDLDRAGIEQREREAVELVELRAALTDLKAWKDAVHDALVILFELNEKKTRMTHAKPLRT